MFEPITIPFGAKMLFNALRLKPGASMEDVGLALGEICNVVKNTYGGDKGGFIAGQAFKFSGFVSDEGSLAEVRGPTTLSLSSPTGARSRNTSARTPTRCSGPSSRPSPRCAPTARNWATTCSGRASPRAVASAPSSAARSDDLIHIKAGGSRKTRIHDLELPWVAATVRRFARLCGMRHEPR